MAPSRRVSHPGSTSTFARQAELERAEDQVAELMAAYRADALPGSIVFPEVAQLQVVIESLRAEKAATTRHAGQARQSADSPVEAPPRRRPVRAGGEVENPLPTKEECLEEFLHTLADALIEQAEEDERLGVVRGDEAV